MVDLARQAVSTKNFDLAAEIYGREIRQNGPKVKLYLGLADSHALNGDLKEAFQAYSVAFRLGHVSIDQLNHLVTSLLEMMNKNEVFLRQSQPKEDDPFACGICKALWNEPVTIGCGHTFCRSCLEKREDGPCNRCGLPHRFRRLSSLRTNVLLSCTTHKWFPSELSGIKLKSRGNALFGGRKFKEAIGYYDQAFVHAPNDHLIVSNRSYAYAALDQYKEALRDAERAIKLRPDWPKGYYRRGVALSGLSQHEEAAFAFLQCLTLDPTATSARTSLAQELHQVLSPLQPENLKHAEYQLLLNSPSFESLAGSGVATSVLSVDMLQRVKATLRDTLTQASVAHQATSHQSSNPSESCDQKTTSNCSPEFDFSQVSIQEKSRSLPGSPKSSRIPLTSARRSLSENDPSVFTHGNDTRLSRKRHGHEMVVGPLSPTRSAPKKQAREEPVSQDKRHVPRELLNAEDFECSLCYRFLFHPVTTSCGHVFCRQCLYRSLDHNNSCPLCKTSLKEHLEERRQDVTVAIEDIMQKYFPVEFSQRTKQNEEEMLEMARMTEDGQHEIPIFVCTLAYPTVACPLHIFEPRYRLMVRQCMESGTRKFGMCTCLADNEEQFADFGCLLEIRDVQYFPDGRSVVDTIGGKRFRVVEHGHKDGYHTAKIEYLEDAAVEPEEVEELLRIHDEVHQMSRDWFASLPSAHQMRVNSQLGEFPAVEHDIASLTNGPAWSWWITAFLPLDPRAQLVILAMTNLRERLVAIRRVLRYVRRQESQ